MVSKRKTSKKGPGQRLRYGIGEWYGRSFVGLSPELRREFADEQASPKRERPRRPCPFRCSAVKQVPCSKNGGVCSIRLYSQDKATGLVSIVGSEAGTLVTTCPHRFRQDGSIYRWVGETLLGDADPLVIGEVGFLEPEKQGDDLQEEPSDVGRIDNVLVRRDSAALQWCALEIQAVYFSGAAMTREFKLLREFEGPALPYPAGHRRPDFRSSGPKRLMPQLQIKVPTLRRWGKKMAVVVDRSFFEALGAMDNVTDVSNCDIAWFVVTYDESDGDAVLRRDFVRLTTLERAVEGLTGGRPVGLSTFEATIREKLAEGTA